MTAPNDQGFFASPSDFLQQGDIFCQEIVTPIADTRKRFFRSTDGRHGSIVFADNVEGNVFEEDELRQQLGSLDAARLRTPLHTEPFTQTADGDPELVIVEAHRTSLFVVASQSCDISGEDKPPLRTAIILPAITLLDIGKREKLPLRHSPVEITIECFLEANAPGCNLKAECDYFRYSVALRRILQEWTPPTNKLAETRNQIRKYMRELGGRGWMYFLKQDCSFGIPESYVDFSVAYTVPQARLAALKGLRRARIGDPYRDQFAQAFGNRIMRIAVPSRVRPEEF